MDNRLSRRALLRSGGGLAAVALAPVWLAACGAPTPAAPTAAPATTTKEQPAATGAAPARAGVTLQYWSFLDTKIRMAGRNDLFPEFEAKSNAKIEVTFVDTGQQDAKVTAAHAAKTLPDMLDAAFMYIPIGWLQAGITRDVTDLVGTLGKDDFPQNVLRMWTHQGKLGAVPFMGYSHIFWLRKDLLAEKGLTIKTWDDIQKAAAAFHGTKTPDGKERYGFPAYFNQRHADHMWQNTIGPHGGSVFDEQNKLALASNKNNLAALDRLRALKPYYAPGYANAVQGDLFTLFQDGLLPFIYGSPTPINAVIKTKPELLDKLDWQLIPTGPGGDPKRGAYLGCYSFMISSTSKALDQAKEFVLWYFSPPVYTRIFPGTDLGHQPVRRSVADSEDFKKAIPPVAHRIAMLGLQALSLGTVPGQDFGPNPVARQLDGINFWSNILNQMSDTDAASALKWGEEQIKKL